MPIERTGGGRLCLRLGDSATPESVLETLRSAFAARPGRRSAADQTGPSWHELDIDGHRFRIDWDRWHGCGVVSEEASGDATLRQIAVWFQDEREVW
jgi:hypothetical protein